MLHWLDTQAKVTRGYVAGIYLALAGPDFLPKSWHEVRGAVFLIGLWLIVRRPKA